VPCQPQSFNPKRFFPETIQPMQKHELKPLHALPASHRRQVELFQKSFKSFTADSILISTPEKDYELVTDLVYVYPEIPHDKLSGAKFRFSLNLSGDEQVLSVMNDKRLEVTVDSATLTSERFLWWDKKDKRSFQVAFWQIDMAYPLLEYPKRGLKILTTHSDEQFFVPLYLHDAWLETLASFLCSASQLAKSFLLDLNQARLEELMQLPLMNEVRANYLIQKREELKGFDSLKQVAEIIGIPPQDLGFLEAKGLVTLLPMSVKKANVRRLDF
jgi:hypothetical protein